MVSSSPSIQLSTFHFDDQQEREREREEQQQQQHLSSQLDDSYNFDYDRFLLRMKHPDCRHIVTKIKYFIHEFNKWSDDDQEKPIKYKEFVEWTGEALLAHPVWQAAPSKYRQDIKEGLEYLIMNQIYSSAFAPALDLESDKHFSLQLHKHKWIEPKHLDTSHSLIIDDQLIEHAKSELENLSSLTTPRDKLLCIMTFCRIIESSLEVHDKRMDADKLMPLIILVLVKVQPRYLISNMRYVQRYRATVHFKSEIGYHFTNLMAAITFIERINKDALVMTDEYGNDNNNNGNEDGNGNGNDNNSDDYYQEKIREMGEFIEYEKSPKSLYFDATRHNGNNNDDYTFSLDGNDRRDYHRHLAGNESDDDILEEGKRVFHKIKSSRVVSKSIGYLKEMMTKAEEAINDALKEAISDDINMSARDNATTTTTTTNSTDKNRNRNNYNHYDDRNDNDSDNDRDDEEQQQQAMRLRRIEEEKEEEEFQLQLAMALSLSEQQYHFQEQYQKQEQEQEKRNQNISKKEKENNSAMKKRSLSI